MSGAGRLVVVGAGLGGMTTALRAVELGHRNVVLVAKSDLTDSNTYRAQGGMSAVLDERRRAPGDSVDAHMDDTVRAGAGMGSTRAVAALCEGAADTVSRLIGFGVDFDGWSSTAGTRYSLGLEAAHSAPRILHGGGDSTGAVIADALIARVLDHRDAGRITLIEGGRVRRVMTGPASVDTASVDTASAGTDQAGPGGRTRVAGVELLHRGVPLEVAADAVVLATGGAGQLFSHTTNPEVATADGVAVAWRAGAVVGDLEFFQFHPTALDPRGGPAAESAGHGGVGHGGDFMISEAVRGEGAVIRDATGYRFMVDVHADAELAPRDVVARGMAMHRRRMEAEERDPSIFLDATGIAARRGADFLSRRFPTIDRALRERGLDWTRQWLPITPAAHYWMGGIVTDIWGRTSIPGLYAVGEAACTGVHGANRLASNSLLEAAVFGGRAARAITGEPPAEWPWFGAAAVGISDALEDPAPAGDRGDGAGATAERADLQRYLWENAGLIRDGAVLAVAAKQLVGWRFDVSDPGLADENRNLLLAGRLMVAAARRREDSVGAHFRTDFPHRPGTAAQRRMSQQRRMSPGKVNTSEASS